MAPMKRNGTKSRRAGLVGEVVERIRKSNSHVWTSADDSEAMTFLSWRGLRRYAWSVSLVATALPKGQCGQRSFLLFNGMAAAQAPITVQAVQELRTRPVKLVIMWRVATRTALIIKDVQVLPQFVCVSKLGR
jgi:hypothetical protein